MKKDMYRKGVVCGILVIFFSSSIVPIVGSLSTEKEQSVISKGYFDGIVISGTMGENGWYVSDVTVTWIHDDVNHTYFRIDGGSWIEYTAPFVVTTDGIHLIEATDDMEHFYYALVKIDCTPPEIILLKETTGMNEITFIANVYDATSGVWRVEFYLDDGLQFTDDDFPFEWIWEGSGSHNVTAMVFDMAGNSASSSMNTQYFQSQSQFYPNIQQYIQLFYHFIHTVISHHRTIH